MYADVMGIFFNGLILEKLFKELSDSDRSSISSVSLVTFIFLVRGSLKIVTVQLDSIVTEMEVEWFYSKTYIVNKYRGIKTN